MTGKLHQFEPTPAQAAHGGGGNGQDFHGRVSAIEARLDYLATKEDIRRVEALISQREVSLQRWMIGLVSGAALAVVVALIRTFV
ncbi:MAG: hypothetical protein OXF74_13775 [Rhodobacteraceae bacterium]|nr:hypothetical protein [Paracoccaceae bacterium]